MPSDYRWRHCHNIVFNMVSQLLLLSCYAFIPIQNKDIFIKKALYFHGVTGSVGMGCVVL